MKRNSVSLSFFVISLIATLALCACGSSSSGTISTYAGDNIAGFSGNGAAATSGELNYPVALALDSSGNLYINDANNGVIREVIESSKYLASIAGEGGSLGYTSAGGTALKITLNGLYGLARDSSGNLYFSDTADNVVQKYDVSAKTVYTIAGTGTAGFSGDGSLATAAELNGPHGVAIDGSGYLYIADTGNNRIRRIDTSTGIITTFAGTGVSGYTGDSAAASAATLNIPYDVAVNSAGDLYISDTANAAVRKVTAATSVITTVAGSGTSGYTGDNAAATSATLNGPRGLFVDSTGNLYICDMENSAVRKVTAATSVISTIAGNGTRGFSGNGGSATNATLFNPTGVIVDSSGQVFIADSGNNVVRRVVK